MQKWCAYLARWYMNSKIGYDEAKSENNHALYFDLSTLSLAVYAMEDDLVDMVRPLRCDSRLPRVQCA